MLSRHSQLFYSPFHTPKILNKRKQQQLYVISPSKMWPSKIGISNDPNRRLVNLQVSHWELLEVIATFQCDSKKIRQIEKMLHEKFKEYLIRSEWFDIDAPEAIVKIAGILGKSPTW